MSRECGTLPYSDKGREEFDRIFAKKERKVDKKAAKDKKLKEVEK